MATKIMAIILPVLGFIKKRSTKSQIRNWLITNPMIEKIIKAANSTLAEYFPLLKTHFLDI